MSEVDADGFLFDVFFADGSQDAADEEVAVGFDEDVFARQCLMDQKLGDFDLQRWMQMNLGILDCHDLVLTKQPGLNHDGSQLVEAGSPHLEVVA
jgi:hypothetical protein